MSGVSKLGKALTFVFAFLLLALLSELLYLLWRRRFLRRHHPPENDGAHDEPPSSNPSKKILPHFFCFKTQSRVEPAGADRARGSDGSPPVHVQTSVTIDPFKMREMYGLFTIKEEEKEDLESEKSLSSANRTKSRNLSQSFEDIGVSPELVVVTIEEDKEEDGEVTSFSTPCASPLYFTPPASPVHEMVGADHETSS